MYNTICEVEKKKYCRNFDDNVKRKLDEKCFYMNNY